MTDNRRAFLEKLAKGVAYSAPVIMSFAAPVELVGQGMSSEHHAMSAASPTSTTTESKELGGPPPWEDPPPGSGGSKTRPSDPFQ